MNIRELHTDGKEVSAGQLFKGSLGLATAIQLEENGVLKEHMTRQPALLLCVEGRASYHDEKENIIDLSPGDYVNILPDVKHWLVGHTNCQLVLFK
jgi:quercetin dioxygenase-like cupin family protein